MSVRIEAPDASAGDQFGRNVSVSGNYMVIGAYADDGARGAAYIFRITDQGNVLFHKKLTAPNRIPDQQFGIDVSIDGDVVVVGAFADDAKGTNAGAAYVYIRGEDW